MAERAGDFEWRTEADEAEIILYASDDSAIDRILPATRLPGIESPAYAAVTLQNFGSIAVSSTHAAPDLVSVPARGLLLTAGTTADVLGIPAEELVRLVFRGLSEVNLPRLGGAGIRRVYEAGAWAAAEEAIVEEEDLSFFETAAGDPDALGRQALLAGEREWDLRTKVRLRVVGDVQDTEKSESLDLESGSIVFVVEAGAGDLGRLALDAHRERILGRIRAGIDFDAEDDLPVAPLDSEEAADLLAASHAAANFADGRAALALYALRRALAGITGELRPVASWKIGGFEERGGLVIHRRGLARIGSGEVLVCGDSVASSTGAMFGSAPPFEITEVEGVWPWEEAGLLGRIADLEELEPRKA